MAEKIFDVRIERLVNIGELRWPARSETIEDAALGGNQEYRDLQGVGWRDVAEMIAKDAVYVRRLLKNDVSEEELNEELWSEADRSGEAPLAGIDPGVAGAVYSLLAAGMITAYSCNGGAFGGHHHASHPIVATHVRVRAVPHLISCAERSGVGVTNGFHGMAIVHADRITGMLAFAEEILGARGEFNRLRRARRT